MSKSRIKGRMLYAAWAPRPEGERGAQHALCITADVVEAKGACERHQEHRRNA